MRRTSGTERYAHALPKAPARYVDRLDGAEKGSVEPMAPNDGTTGAVAAVGSDATVAIAESGKDGPARNRTANPLIKSADPEHTEPISADEAQKKSDDEGEQ